MLQIFSQAFNVKQVVISASKLLFFLFLVHLAGCASTLQTQQLLSQPPNDLSTTHFIPDLPFFAQEDYQCGPAALATVLVDAGIDTSPDELVPLVYIPGRKGSFQLELTAASRSLGGFAYTLDNNLLALLSEVNAGNPVLVLQNLGLSIYPQWHFAVVKGYDLENRLVILNSGTIEDYQLSLSTFERTWRRTNFWAITIVQAGEIPATAEADKYFLALVDFQTSYSDQQVVSRAYRAGISQWPANPNLSMAFGNYLYELGDLEAAADVLLNLTLQNKTYAPAYNNLAHVLYELGQYQSALSFAESAIEFGGAGIQSFLNTRQMIQEKLEL